MRYILKFAIVPFMGVALALGCTHNERLPTRETEPPVRDEPRAARPEEQPPAQAPQTEPTPFDEVSEEELQMALDRAIDAAISAQGGSPCEKSYNAMVAMRDSLVADLGNAAAQDLPSRQRFIEACEELPKDAQQCMDVSFAMENQADCQRIMEGVPREQRRALEEVLQGR